MVGVQTHNRFLSSVITPPIEQKMKYNRPYTTITVSWTEDSCSQKSPLTPLSMPLCAWWWCWHWEVITELGPQTRRCLDVRALRRNSIASYIFSPW